VSAAAHRRAAYPLRPPRRERQARPRPHTRVRAPRVHRRPADRASDCTEPKEGRLMPNKQGHRRFGNVRRLPSGRYQVRYPGPEGRWRGHPQTLDRRGGAGRPLALIEPQITAGEWPAPQRGTAGLGDYARDWIPQRPGLRARTVDFYRWLLAKHIEP